MEHQLSYRNSRTSTEEYELLQQQDQSSRQESPAQPPLSHYPTHPPRSPLGIEDPVNSNIANSGPIARRGFLHTIWSNAATITALLLGITGSAACYGFTYWLSKQIFECPQWSLYCEVHDDVQWIAEHLGQVQGFVSAFYGAFLSMIAFVAYRLAETTLWPSMAQRSFRLSDVDKFLEVTRGYLPALPQALWHSFYGGLYHASTVILVGLLTVLLFFTTVFVGHAYTIERVPTQYLSNFTVGAGVGFSFSQTNPPGTYPAAIGEASAVYTAWANNMTVEPLPELRDYILDRRNLDKVGQTTVNAVKASRQVNCSAIPIRITQDIQVRPRLGDVDLQVATHIPNSGDSDDDDYYELNNDHDEDGYRDVSIRVQPYMAVWVDQYRNTSATRAVTRLVFAAVNGTIEGAYHVSPTRIMKAWADNDISLYTGIDALTCDVDIDLVDSQACAGLCTETNSTLSSLETLSSPDPHGDRWISGTRNLWSLAVWLAVMPATLGTSVFGNQPLFQIGPLLNNSMALPIAYTTTDTEAALSWTQANLTNFIDVAAGALGITITASFPLNYTANVTISSLLETPRLQPDRSFVLLAPIISSIIIVLLLTLLSVLSYHQANVQDVRLGKVTDIVVSVQTSGIRSIIESVRRGELSQAGLDEVQLRYGIVLDGHDGIGVKGEVQRLR